MSGSSPGGQGAGAAVGPPKRSVRRCGASAETAWTRVGGKAARAASASSGVAKSRVPAAMTVRPGRNFSVAGLGVVSVSISIPAMWRAGAR